MGEGKVLNIGSKRTLLLLSLLLLVTFAVLLVTLLPDSGPPEPARKKAEVQSPQTVRGRIQLPQPIEVTGPSPTTAAPLLAVSPTKGTQAEAPPTPAASPEAARGRAGEPAKLLEKRKTADVKPAVPEEKPASPVEAPKPPQTASVESKKGPSPAPTTGRKYTVQVGAFSEKNQADKFAADLRKSGFDVRVEPTVAKNDRTMYRVRVGMFGDILEAKKMEARLQGKKGVTSTMVREIK